jgi:histidyl-tRNA synthetase
MGKKISIPRGTSDILPAESIVWQHVERRSRDLLERYGYREIRTPFFEKTGLFARSMGETSDVVQKQMLSLSRSPLQDSDDVLEKDGLSLRPEGTASIVRSYIENNLDKQENLSKLYYVGAMFRGERPQKGRLRQFHQIGVEAIGPGSASPFLDAEVIALAVRLLQDLGLKDFELKLNTLGSPGDKEVFSKNLRQALQPRLQDLCPDCRQRVERNVFRVLDCKNRTCRAVVDQLDLRDKHLSAQSREYFLKVKEALDTLGVRYTEDPNLVRGLDYYNHTVFEITTSVLGSQDALGAGGRYNDLVQQLGGPDVDAVGFALGIERILLALPAQDKPPAQALDVFVIALNENAQKTAFRILNALRHGGLKGDMSYRLASVKSLMRQADKSGARHVFILGEDEMQKGIVTIKNMREGTQSQEPQDQLGQWLACLPVHSRSLEKGK